MPLWRIWVNKVFIFTLLVHWHWRMSETLSATWCLRGRSNGTREHSLVTLMWLVNNIMIEVLPTWRMNLPVRSNFLRGIQMNCETGGDYFSVAIWTITGNFVSTSSVSFVWEFHVAQIMPMWKEIIMLVYSQKPASVNAFYTPYLASKFPCLFDFAAASSQLCAHVRHKDGCLSVNSAFALTDRKRGPVVSCTSGRKLGKFVHFVKNK